MSRHGHGRGALPTRQPRPARLEADQRRLPTPILRGCLAVFFQYLRFLNGRSGIQALDLDHKFPLIAKVVQKADAHPLGERKSANGDFVRKSVVGIPLQKIEGIDFDRAALRVRPKGTIVARPGWMRVSKWPAGGL
jgi:hypothetical protein